jgi:hypothetical protein
MKEAAMTQSESYILFDTPGGETPVDHEFLERLGHPVEVCGGPGEGACPLVEGKGCPLAERAHGVVFELDLDEPKHQAILRKYKSHLRDDLPIRVAVRPGQAEKPELSRLKVLAHRWSDLDALAAESKLPTCSQRNQGLVGCRPLV